MRPFPTKERNEVGVFVFASAADFVALTHRGDSLFPAPLGERSGVVIDRPEVQVRTEARVVASVGDRVKTFTSRHRQRELKRIDRKRAVYMQVAKQNLLRIEDTEIICSFRLSFRAVGDCMGGQHTFGGRSSADRSAVGAAAGLVQHVHGNNDKNNEDNGCACESFDRLFLCLKRDPELSSELSGRASNWV